jgi:hypothetical protein
VGYARRRRLYWLASPSAKDALHRQRSEILFEPAGEDPVGVDLEDAERLLDQR